MTNPLLHVQFEVPFDQIQAGHVEPAIDEHLKRAQAAIDAVIASEGPRTYANTVDPLERATEPLEWAMGLVSHLESTATSDALRDAYNAIQSKVAAFYSAIPLNEPLWQAIKAAADHESSTKLPPTEARNLRKTIEGFRRSGADLDTAGKARLSAINVELSQLTTKFSQNVLDSTNRWELIIEDASQLAGLPASAMDAARHAAEAKGVSGWRFTLQAPSYIPLVTYLDDASIREQVYRAYNTRATSGDLDNRPLIGKILALRAEKAKVLGYASFADLVLEDRMAKTGAEAQRFIDELRDKTHSAFESENERLLAFRRELEGPQAHELQPWDIAYYAEKLRKAQFDFDDEQLRPYFPLAAVLHGMFNIANRLFGVTIQPAEQRPTWDASATAYELHDHDGTLLAAFYVDFYPRDNKRGGAWMHGLMTGVESGSNLEPHLAVICGNVTPPVGDRPALLTHNEVETLFHEFGHLIHHCLSRVSVRSLAGTNVAWDFVELPSQIMENWCWEKPALDMFARHHETGEPIPDALFDRLQKARTFRAANAMMRQLGFASVDLALHIDYNPARDGDPTPYATAHLQAFAPASFFDGYAMLAGFNHIFASPVGYAAGYYSYKWAEVLDADAFTRFRDEGIFSRDVGLEFRSEILSQGDSRDPMELYQGFMGRPPRVEPLLERSGLSNV